MPLSFQRLTHVVRPLLRACAVATAVGTLCPVALAHQNPVDVQINRVWQYAHVQGGVPGQKSEIVAYDDRTDTLWVAGVVGVDVLDRATGNKLAHISVTNLGAVNGVAIHDGLAALAIESAPDRTQPGVVVFFDTRTRAQHGQPVPVGALPDMLTFTPNGKQVLVANEATPNARPTPVGLSADDPQGSVSIVDVRTRTVTTLPITPAIPGYDTLRLFPAAGTLPTQPATFSAYGPEPEYIAVDPDGRTAYVGLQEANAIAVLNLKTQKFEQIYSLGLKDFSLPGNEIDTTDRNESNVTDGVALLRSVPVKGLYQPDTLATYKHRGKTYVVMANEGDARDNGAGDGEDERRGSAGSGASRLVPSTEPFYLFRTTYSNIESTPSNLVKFGGHSFSIREVDGTVVFDSGSDLDRQAIARGIYDDGRSDNKGVEPEGLALMHIEGRVLAFVGLERTVALKSAFAVYDITDPKKVKYIDMIVSDGDTSPEGLVAFRAGKRHFLAVANEVSDSTSLFEIDLSHGRGRDDDRRDH